MKTSLYIILLCIFIVSCGNDNTPKPVARVFNDYLYENDLKGITLKSASKSDSTHIAELYIHNWVHERILMHEAEQKLTEEEKNKEKQLAEYKRDLLIYSLERKIISAMPDSTVSLTEIRKYYSENHKEFELKKNLVRLNYIKLPKSAPRIDIVKHWFYSAFTQDKKNLSSFAALYADNYFFADTVWLDFADILKEIPLRAYDEEQFLRLNTKTILEDGSYFYLIDIRDFRIKNDVSPFDLEVNRIRNILENKKKILYIEKTENDLYKKAENDEGIEIYGKKK